LLFEGVATTVDCFSFLLLLNLNVKRDEGEELPEEDESDNGTSGEVICIKKKKMKRMKYAGIRCFSNQTKDQTLEREDLLSLCSTIFS